MTAKDIRELIDGIDDDAVVSFYVDEEFLNFSTAERVKQYMFDEFQSNVEYIRFNLFE